MNSSACRPAGLPFLPSLQFRALLPAVAQEGFALEYAAEELRGDREVVLTAVRQRGHALRFAAAELREDVDIRFACNFG